MIIDNSLLKMVGRGDDFWRAPSGSDVDMDGMVMVVCRRSVFKICVVGVSFVVVVIPM